MSNNNEKKDQDTKKEEEDKETIDSSSQTEEKTKKKKFIFNCTKCGQCCEKREFVPVSLADIRNWTANGTINKTFQHLKIHTFPTNVGGETREAISIVLTGSEKGCSMYDQEDKLCNIYHSMPLECKAFPLGFNGQNYVIKDKTVPGLGNGTMTKDRLIADRDNARSDYDARVETQMLLPLTYSLFMKNLLEQQEKIRDEMPEDKRQELEDFLKGDNKEETDQPEVDGE
ncbi:MAG: YkgJ family cysteine cluster protein [Candidatus Hodarchaeales archaeon]